MVEIGDTLVVRKGNKVLDRIRLTSNGPDEIEGISLDLQPGKRFEFIRVDGGWMPLHPDPFLDTPCFSRRTTPLCIDATPPSWYKSLLPVLEVDQITEGKLLLVCLKDTGRWLESLRVREVTRDAAGVIEKVIGTTTHKLPGREWQFERVGVNCWQRHLPRHGLLGPTFVLFLQ